MQNISEAERAIMNLIWKNGGSVYVSDLFEETKAQGFDWGYSTVRTFLARLIEKGYLETKKHGKVAEYIAAVSEEEYLAGQAQAFVKTVFDGNVKGLLTSLFGQDSLSRDQIEELEAFWKAGREEIE